MLSSSAGLLRPPFLTQSEVAAILRLTWRATHRVLERHGIPVIETGPRSRSVRADLFEVLLGTGRVNNDRTGTFSDASDGGT